MASTANPRPLTFGGEPLTADRARRMRWTATGMLAAVKGRPVAEEVIAVVAERLEDAMRSRGTEVTSSAGDTLRAAAT